MVEAGIPILALDRKHCRILNGLAVQGSCQDIWLGHDIGQEQGEDRYV